MTPDTRATPLPDFAIPRGWFFKQANGFSGAGDLGYTVTVDAQANFWTEFQRSGGVQKGGYPLTLSVAYLSLK